MVKYEDIDQKIVEKYNLWRSARDSFLEEGMKMREYYNSDVEGTRTRFTQEQLKKIGEGLAIPLSINFIYHLIEQKLALLNQVKPTFKITSLDERAKEFAYVLEKANKHIMYHSSAVGEEEEAIKDMLIMGMGITGLVEQPEYQVGTFPVKYERIAPELVILDANSRKRDLSDMRGYFIEKEITVEDAKYYYQGIIDEINRRGLAKDISLEQWNSYTFNSPSGNLPAKGFNDTLILKEYYDKVYTTAYYIEVDGDIKKIFKENIDPEQFLLLEGLIIDFEQNRFVRKRTYLNDKLIDETIKGISNFPITVKFFEWNGFPYKCYGAIHYIKDMQNAYDRVMHTFIVNGMLTNNAGYITPENSISPAQKEKWEKLGNRPGTIKEFKPYIIGNAVIKPEREQIQQLSNFFPNVLEMLRIDMESSTGINPIVQGNPQEAKIDVFSTAQQYQNSAMMRIQLAMSHINLSNEYIGRVLIEMLPNMLNPNQIYMFYDERGKLNEIKIVGELLKTFKLSKYLLLSVPDESTPSQKAAMVTALMNVAQTTEDPMQREIYRKRAFELADIRGFDEMAEELNTARELQSQIQQLQEALKRQEELSKQFENRAERSETTAKVIDSTYRQLIPVIMEIAKMGKEVEIAQIEEKLEALKEKNKMEKSTNKES